MPSILIVPPAISGGAMEKYRTLVGGSTVFTLYTLSDCNLQNADKLSRKYVFWGTKRGVRYTPHAPPFRSLFFT